MQGGWGNIAYGHLCKLCYSLGVEHTPSQMAHNEPLDAQELDAVLKKNHLAGIAKVVDLVIRDASVSTYERLIDVLSRKNEFGNFQYVTSNTSLAHSIILEGERSGDAYPEFTIVVAKEAIAETLEVIHDHVEEVLQRSDDESDADAPEHALAA